jgi:hypothetical protein
MSPQAHPRAGAAYIQLPGKEFISKLGAISADKMQQIQDAAKIYDLIL